MISIIIPTYNSEYFISDTLESIINQSIRSFELVIVDDGSKDKTLKKIHEFIKKYPEVNCIVIEQENHGPSYARNRGLEKANGRYIQFFDSDDIMHPQKLEISLKAIESDSNNGAVITDLIRFSGSLDKKYNRTYQENEFLRNSMNGSRVIIQEGIGSPRVLYDRRQLEKVGGFNEDLKNNEDHELNFRLLCSGCQFKYLPFPLMYYRQYESDHRLTKSKERFIESIKASKVILDQITQINEKKLHDFARVCIANKIAYSGVGLIRMGKFHQGKDAIKLAKSLSKNLKASNRKWLNLLNQIFGIGQLDMLVGIYNKMRYS